MFFNTNDHELSIKPASTRLNLNNTVKKVQWTFESEAENLAKYSAVPRSPHTQRPEGTRL